MMANHAALFPEFNSPSAEVLFADHHSEPLAHLAPDPPGTLQPGWLLTLTLAGSRHFMRRGGGLTATRGVIALVRVEPSVGPTRAFDDPWECFFVRFRLEEQWTPPRPFEQAGDGLYGAEITSLAWHRIQDAFARIAADAQASVASHAVALLDRSPDLDTESLEMEARRQLMLMTLREIFLVAQTDAIGVTRLDARIRNALSVMSSDLGAAHSVASIARSCDLSESHFAHLFREQLGTSPLHALRLMRLRQAALKLKYTSDTLEKIAATIGFSSSSHLSREFRRAFGLSPRAFRAQASLKEARKS